MNDDGAGGPVFSPSPDADPGMRAAMQAAQATLPLFWRELHWEMHRIIPFIDMSVMKVAFSDDPSMVSAIDTEGHPGVEYMWLSNLRFDGVLWGGEVLNSPHALQSVRLGDVVSFSSALVADWTFRMVDQTMGGYTNQHLRSKMNAAERAEFDAMQGMDLGDPASVQLMAIEPAPYPVMMSGLLKKKEKVVKGPIQPIAQKAADIFAREHGMAESMAERFPDDIVAQPELVTHVDPDDGFTVLHRMALAGATNIVRSLVAAGADTSATTLRGLTAQQLAQSQGWERTVAVLQAG